MPEDSPLRFHSPRGAAHYEAQRLVLQYVLQGAQSSPHKQIRRLIEEKYDADMVKQWSGKEAPPSLEALASEVRKSSSEQQLEQPEAELTTEEQEQEQLKPAKAKKANMSAIRMQALVRGFLGRQRVRRIIMQRLATMPGVLVAIDGTKQGGTGWYSSQGQMFYFCLDDTDLVLMCGPITRDLYEAAKQEVAALPKYGTLMQTPSAALPQRIVLDRVGLQAMRIQVDTLLNDLAERDEFIAIAELKIQDQIKANKAQGLQLEEYAQALQQFNAAQSELQLLKAKHADSVAQVFATRLLMLTAAHKKALVRITALVRGFIARKKVRRLKLSRLADDTGVLVAMENTKQGTIRPSKHVLLI